MPPLSPRQSLLPAVEQQWSHSTVSTEKLRKALTDESITAIETDILMGRMVATATSGTMQQQEEHRENEHDMGGEDSNPRQKETSSSSSLNNSTSTAKIPIMAHPPSTESDLSVRRFFELATATTNPPSTTHPSENSTNSDDGSCFQKGRTLRKHLKLDFKEIEAIPMSLKIWRDLGADPNGKTIFLNADILPGPGRSEEDVIVPADDFLETCLSFISEENKDVFAFSLGFKVDVVSLWGHSDQHLSRMMEVLEQYRLCEKSAGVVLAINARLLAKSMKPFDKFLDRYPTTQLLVWTGATEPPVTHRKIHNIRTFFQRRGKQDRIGFDCQVSSTFMLGFAFDVIIMVLGVHKVIRRTIMGNFRRNKAD